MCFSECNGTSALLMFSLANNAVPKNFSGCFSFGLVAFYLSTTAESDWKISNRWKTEQSECKWYGITCDDDGITVTEISLPRNRMR